jgi:hypothetical protein
MGLKRRAGMLQPIAPLQMVPAKAMGLDLAY